jgi:hypothetical protein
MHAILNGTFLHSMALSWAAYKAVCIKKAILLKPFHMYKGYRASASYYVRTKTRKLTRKDPLPCTLDYKVKEGCCLRPMLYMSIRIT